MPKQTLVEGRDDLDLALSSFTHAARSMLQLIVHNIECIEGGQPTSEAGISRPTCRRVQRDYMEELCELNALESIYITARRLTTAAMHMRQLELAAAAGQTEAELADLEGADAG